MAKALVIGGGFAGCIAAHMLSKKHDVTLIERMPELGGSCRTYWWGGHPYTLGPRHFLTKREDVWAYMNEHCPMKHYQGHEFLTYIEQDKVFYHFPIHRDEVDLMPDADSIKAELIACPGPAGAVNLEDYWQRSVGNTLYGKFVENYSKKMWGIESNTEITDFGFTPKGVALKEGPDKAAWSEAMSGFPKAANGYNDYFPKATADVTVKKGLGIQRLEPFECRAQIDGQWSQWDIVVNTISPEYLFDSCFGKLRWMGREFLKIVLPVESVFPENVFFLYYANAEPFTRIVEYKKFYDYDSPTTLLGIEIPSNKNKLYPYPMKADQDQHAKYLEIMPERGFSIGRMGSYRYLDVGMIIEQCFDMVEKLDA